MRNLKKTLCLVLALVFVLGLCTVGAADADFSDAADIDAKYVDAVKVLSGLKILTGYPEGDFRPEKEVTRAEAATIIARICLGVDNAGLYPARATFSDVSKDHFASRAINYCVNNGIINGYGDGTFRPSKPVTQAQLCKMLLAAVGYGQNGEFTGSEWDANVAEIAFKTKILKNLQALDWDAAATREETSLLGYNTLMSVDQVKYSKDSSSYTPVGSAGSSTISDDAVWNMNSATGIVLQNKASGAQLTILSSGLEVTTDSDADAALLGHKILVRYSKDDKVAYYVEDLSTEEAYSAAMDPAIASANSGTRYYWTNGVSANTAYPSGKGTPGTFILDEKRIIIGYKAVESFFLAELYKTKEGKWAVNDGTERLLTGVPADAKEKDIVCVQLLGNVYNASATTKEEGVLVTQMANGMWNGGAIKATVATGYFDKTGKALTKFAGKLTDNTTDLVPNAVATYTVYKDGKGGTYAVEATKGDTNVAEDDVYLVAAWSLQAADNQFGEAGAISYYIQVVTANGERKELLTGVGTQGNDYTKATPTGNVYKLVMNGDYAVISAPEKYTVETMAKGDYKALSTNVKYDFKDAKFMSVNGEKSACVVKLGAPIDADNATGKYICTELAVGTTKVKSVVAVWFDKEKTSDVATDYIYVSTGKIKETKIDADGKSYDYFAGYKNGVAATDLKVASGTAIPAAGFYTGYTVNSNGTYDMSKITASATTTAALKYNGTDYILNGKLYVSGVGMDLTDVALIDLSNSSIATIADLEAAIVKNQDKTYTLEFVQVAAGTGKAIGGKMILLKSVA